MAQRCGIYLWLGAVLRLFIIVFFGLHLVLPAKADQSIVPRDNQISDNTVRIVLADLLGQRDDAASLAKAETLLRRVLSDDPENRDALALQAPLLLRQGRLAEALDRAQYLHASDPESLPWLLLLADVHAAAGHYAICRDLYRDALTRKPDESELIIRFADRSNLWGDFNTVEKYLRALLQVRPEDNTIRLRLGRVLFSQQRYEEATGLLRALLRQSGLDREFRRQVILLLIDIQRMEKDYASAHVTARQALQQSPEFMEVALAQGELFLLEGKPAEAGEVFRSISNASRENTLRYSALVGLGRSLLRQGDYRSAVAPLQEALVIAPQAAVPQLYLQLAHGAEAENIATYQTEKPSVLTLSTWGDTLAAEGSIQAAIGCYNQALRIDPQHFPSRMGLAQVLASAHRLPDALHLLEALHAEFPESDKVRLTMARVLSWDKQYKAGLKVYEDLLQENPGNPTPRREAARTAYWGKMPDLGSDYYRTIYAQPVDRLLVQWQSTASPQGPEPDPHQPAEQSSGTGGIPLETLPDTAPFLVFESLRQRLPLLQGELRRQVEEALRDLEPDYRLQKAAYLERQAKQLAYGRRPILATRSLGELLDLQPGNEEALFDLAQNQCMLGLYRCERATWERLVQLDPTHNLANYALQRSLRRSNPALGGGFSLWEEEGHGDLSQMTHGHAETKADMLLDSKHKVGVGIHQFWEQPKQSGPERRAYGPSIGLESVIDEYLSTSAEILAKQYDGGPDATTTGHCSLTYTVDDYARIRLGYRRSEEFANTFALEHDIQADHLKASLEAFPLGRLELGFGYEHIFFTDDNDQRLMDGSIKILLTDHPSTLSLAVNVEHRHTEELTRSIYQGETLQDIVHPYWTPQNYLSTNLTLGWRHDISEFSFCGSQLHYYDIKLTGGVDSEDDLFFRSSAAWHWEFQEHWTVDVEGMAHDSDQWKAQSLATGLSYRF